MGGCWELEQGVGAGSGGVAVTRFVPVVVIVTAVVVMDDDALPALPGWTANFLFLLILIYLMCLICPSCCSRCWRSRSLFVKVTRT